MNTRAACRDLTPEMMDKSEAGLPRSAPSTTAGWSGRNQNQRLPAGRSLKEDALRFNTTGPVLRPPACRCVPDDPTGIYPTWV